MATVVKAPNPYHLDNFTIFLAGAIDQGKARNWQEEVAKKLEAYPITILSPRRDDWDDTWEQCSGCKPFRSQVLWEIAAQERANLIIFVFTKESKAPISFFEYGAFGTRKDSMICAENGFYRQANLDIYAEHFGTPMYHTLDELIADVIALLEEQKKQKENANGAAA